MWFQLSSLFLWEDVGFSCDSKNAISKQQFKPNPALPLPQHAWGKVDVFHLDICDPGVGAGALPALRNFVFWCFFGHEMGRRVWSCSSQRWGHSIGTALKSSDFLPQGKGFQPRPAAFQHCISLGCPSSSSAQRTPGIPQTNLKQEVSGSVPQGWVWGSPPPWAAIQLLSFLTRDILPAHHQPGAVVNNWTGRAPQHPAGTHRSSSCPKQSQVSTTCPSKAAGGAACQSQGPLLTF